MENESKKVVKFAPWMVTLTATLFVTVMGFTVRGSVRMGQLDNQVIVNKADIIYLDEVKANKEKLDMTYDAVLRLEQKFDDYLSKTQ